MALTFTLRPAGRILSQTEVIASVTNSAGDALFTKTTHGLVTNNTIFIKSTRSAYNGFWLVTNISANTFKVRGLYNQTVFQPFIATGNVSYYFGPTAHLWSCVHLPIVYQLSSNLWPINTADTARTVSSFSNSNGYTRVNLSGDIKASGSADALEQVKISGTASLDGIYKILSWSSDVNFVIDLSYASTNSFAGGTMQYYYGNYHAIIRIYAGLSASHYWTAYKPYELVGTIRQAPNEDGLINFNVSEFLKKKINLIGNNLLLDTLPNNTDAFCYAYIDYAESYDDANQYGTNDLNVSEYVGPFTSTSGSPIIAMNAKLPFKTRDPGYMSDYITGPSDAPLQKWLTTFAEPTLFVGHYFDVSFIIDDTTTRSIERNVYDVNDVLLGTFTDVITNMHEGVYRYAVARSAFLEAYITLTIKGGSQDSEILRINISTDCTAQDFYVTWLNSLGGYDYWNFTAEAQYGTDTIESKTQEKNIYSNWPRSYSEFSDTILGQTVRRTRDNIILNSQYLSETEMDGLSLIFESPLVQEVNSVYDRCTIILEGGSFNKSIDNQKLLMVTTKARYTYENPSQSL